MTDASDRMDAADKRMDAADQRMGQADAVVRDSQAERLHDQANRVQDIADSNVMRDALIAGLAGAAADLSQVGHELYKATVVSRWQRVVAVSVIVIGLTMTGMIGWGVIRINGVVDATHTNSNVNRQTLTEIRASSDAARQTLALLQACTTDPTAVCYRLRTASTNAAIANLTRFMVIAVECAHTGGTDAVIEACVRAKAKGQSLIP